MSVIGGRLLAFLQRLFPPETRRDCAWLALAAIVLYVPAIWWGVPYATGPDRVRCWGTDQLAPLGPITELHNVFLDSQPHFNPQYPLFPYFTQAVFVGPYVAWLFLTGGFRPYGNVGYPYGFTHPITALATMAILARLASLLMAVGVVVAAYRTGIILKDRRTGLIFGILAMLTYPMFYYARTSNVDMGALFWISLGLAVFAATLRGGLTDPRAFWLGLLAALATASKDASWAVFFAIALVIVPRHLLSGGAKEQGRTASRKWKPLAIGLVAAAATYVIASGWIFHQRRFHEHLEFILGMKTMMVYPKTAIGYWNLTREIGGHVLAALGTPVLVLCLVGILRCALRERILLLLVLPSIVIVAAIFYPVHFVQNIRQVMPIAYSLSLFAALGFAWLFEAESSLLRKAAMPVLVIACGWSLVRGLDFTYQMINDSRLQVGAWLKENARPGDRIGYYTAPGQVPALAAELVLVRCDLFCSASDWTGDKAPEIVLVIPCSALEPDHEWTMPRTIYQGLQDGSLGYRRAFITQTRSLFYSRPVPFVNPPIQAFVKNGHPASRLPANSSPRRPAPVLGSIEQWFGVSESPPHGIELNVAVLPGEPICPDIMAGR